MKFKYEDLEIRQIAGELVKLSPQRHKGHKGRQRGLSPLIAMNTALRDSLPFHVDLYVSLYFLCALCVSVVSFI